MLLPRWRNGLWLKNALVPTLSQSTTKIQFASIHCTPITCEKKKSKGNTSYIRLVVRRRRADARRALNDLLYYSGSCQAEDQIRAFDSKYLDDIDDRKWKCKSSAQRAGKSPNKKKKSKFRREYFYDSDDAGRMSDATFRNRCFIWSFNKSSYGGSTSEFERREHQNWKNHRTKEWDTTSEAESDDESYSAGSHSDRTILGLPPTGPLKIVDVKNAFRLLALKWHPDKHQGPSQAMAEEKFKLCATAYKSLCHALSGI